MKGSGEEKRRDQTYRSNAKARLGGDRHISAATAVPASGRRRGEGLLIDGDRPCRSAQGSTECFCKGTGFLGALSVCSVGLRVRSSPSGDEVKTLHGGDACKNARDNGEGLHDGLSV